MIQPPLLFCLFFFGKHSERSNFVEKIQLMDSNEAINCGASRRVCFIHPGREEKGLEGVLPMVVVMGFLFHAPLLYILQPSEQQQQQRPA